MERQAEAAKNRDKKKNKNNDNTDEDKNNQNKENNDKSDKSKNDNKDNSSKETTDNTSNNNNNNNENENKAPLALTLPGTSWDHNNDAPVNDGDGGSYDAPIGPTNSNGQGPSVVPPAPIRAPLPNPNHSYYGMANGMFDEDEAMRRAIAASLGDFSGAGAGAGMEDDTVMGNGVSGHDDAPDLEAGFTGIAGQGDHRPREGSADSMKNNARGSDKDEHEDEERNNNEDMDDANNNNSNNNNNDNNNNNNITNNTTSINQEQIDPDLELALELSRQEQGMGGGSGSGSGGGGAARHVEVLNTEEMRQMGSNKGKGMSNDGGRLDTSDMMMGGDHVCVCFVCVCVCVCVCV